MTGLVIADRVKETTATTGTGTLNLAGAATQFQSFISAVGTGNQCNYCLLGSNGTDWETGIGTVTSGSPNTLSRSIVLASSNSGSLISLTGTSTVFLTEPAAALTNRLLAPIVPPPAATNWTQKNFGGTTTITNVGNGVALFDSSTAAVGVAIRGITMASPSTPYTIDANLAALMLAASGGSMTMGIGWTDGTKIESLFTFCPASGSQEISVNTYSNFTTFNTQPASSFTDFNPDDLFMRIADNGTTVTLSLSVDGVLYISIYSVAKSSGYLGSSGYSNVGLFLIGGGLGNGGSANVTIRSWYQH